MFNREIFVKSLYDWRTFIIGILIFLIAFSIYSFTIQPSFGGCSGCIPDGNGGLKCINNCQAPSPIYFILVSYLISYIVVVLYKHKSPR